ncbi:putative Dol-P-Man:Man(7)GlcNAc(2)-PP-Dol alpha-1,6-mannosyltransferase [Grifola frondosa]|uniref:Mannosyltransferase n=1 Tax=Grifola frondosa TaxID=5627 RepID=A0A1C7LN23_GRIFR|nr:putative Dol-P-Man:Man(7)GlcNAc(2)-PP-Dol alpha-1,6-mannosyltransferase [Grifola frondosa]
MGLTQMPSKTKYDHFVFPGAVPRTFVGSIALASLSYPIIQVASLLEFVSDKADLQVIVRLVLATLNAIGFCLLRRAVSRRFGHPTSVFFVLLTCTQFHLPFWMGRALPNMFALFPVNLAMYFLLNRGSNSNRPSQSNVHAGHCLAHSLLRYHTTLAKVIEVGLLSVVSSVGLTLIVDSYMWQRWPLWPEFYGLYFNVIQGKSSDWGVSPFYTYFTSFLPKLLLSSLPLSLIGALLDPRVRALLVPAIAFLALISGLGHKEWRFVVYVVPLFNIAAARSAAWMMNRRKGTLFGRLCIVVVAGLLMCNCAATYLLARASIANYPGGAALSAFNHIYAGQDTVHVHISNLAAQTGASLFLHTHAPPYLPGLPIPQARNWTYDKTERLSPKALTADPMITHVIAESASAFAARQWAVVGAVGGFDGWRVNRDVISGFKMGLIQGLKGIGRVLEMVKSEKLFILERKG